MGLIACKHPINKRTIHIATATNMQFAINEIATSFEKKTGVQCEIILGSSGKLTAQINEGAPYDIFISADMKYPLELFNRGKVKSQPEIYALGSLVLWSMDTIQPTIEMLTEHSIKHIAIANPKIAPYGKAAFDVLMGLSTFNQVEPKLVYGESITQTNQFILSKSVEIGITSKSTVLNQSNQQKGCWIEINPNLHDPIEQGIVQLNENDSVVNSFYNFIFSKEAQQILKQNGYLIPN